MTDEDTRSLPAAAQAALRTRAVRAVLGGMTQAEAARVFGVHPNAVNRWIRRYREGGLAGLSARRRGRRAGEQAALTETQQQRWSRWCARRPRTSWGWRDFCGPGGGRRADRPPLWRAVGPHDDGYLRRWGFSPQKPQRRALEQNPAAVRRWLAETYPAIRAQARREGGRCCGWTRWGCARMRPRVAPGRRWADPGHQGDRQVLPSQHAQRHLQRRPAAVPPVHRVVHRRGVHRVPRPAAGR